MSWNMFLRVQVVEHLIFTGAPSQRPDALLDTQGRLSGINHTRGEWQETDEESDVRLAVEGKVNRMMGGEERRTAEVLETSHQPQSFRKGTKVVVYLDTVCSISVPNSVIPFKIKKDEINFVIEFQTHHPDNKGETTAVARTDDDRIGNLGRGEWMNVLYEQALAHKGHSNANKSL